MINRTFTQRACAMALLTGSFALGLAIPVLAGSGIANAQSRDDEARRNRGRDEQYRYGQYYRQPNIYYSAPPIYYPPPVYYAPQGPSLNLSFPLWR